MPSVRPRPLRTAVGGAVALVFLVAGCSDPAPEPAPLDSSPSASAEPTPTADPEPTTDVEGPPQMPAAAKGTSRKSAEAFVRYAVDVLNYTSETTETQALARISTGECAACSAITRDVDELKSAGGRLDGGLWRIRQIDAIGRTVDGVQLVQAVVRIQPQKVIRGGGNKVTRYAGGRAFYDIRLVTSNRTWKLASIVEGSV